MKLVGAVEAAAVVVPAAVHQELVS